MEVTLQTRKKTKQNWFVDTVTADVGLTYETALCTSLQIGCVCCCDIVFMSSGASVLANEARLSLHMHSDTSAD